MENSTIEENKYDKAKRDARIFYLRIGNVWCPQIGIEVVFNRAGFQHLIRKGKIQRSKAEQIGRFSILKYAPIIIGNHNAQVTYKTKDLGNTVAGFWIFKQKLGMAPITVVVRRIGNGGTHFFSIY
jgi:hypothetical protein